MLHKYPLTVENDCPIPNLLGPLPGLLLLFQLMAPVIRFLLYYPHTDPSQEYIVGYHLLLICIINPVGILNVFFCQSISAPIESDVLLNFCFLSPSSQLP